MTSQQICCAIEWNYVMSTVYFFTKINSLQIQYYLTEELIRHALNILKKKFYTHVNVNWNCLFGFSSPLTPTVKRQLKYCIIGECFTQWEEVLGDSLQLQPIDNLRFNQYPRSMNICWFTFPDLVDLLGCPSDGILYTLVCWIQHHGLLEVNVAQSRIYNYLR